MVPGVPGVEAKAVDSMDEASGVNNAGIMKAVVEASNMVMMKRRKRANDYDAEYEEEGLEQSEKHDKFDEDEVIDVGPKLKEIDSKFLGEIDKVKKGKKILFEKWLKILEVAKKILFKLWETKHLKKDDQDGEEQILYEEKHLCRTCKSVKKPEVKKALKLKLPKEHKSPLHPSHARRRYLNLSSMLGIIPTPEENRKH